MTKKAEKTRDRILLASLDLFNIEGEPNVTTVDIANQIDISPGNLYYHFHGKEVIVRALYDEFDGRMRSILNAPIEKPLKTEDNWFYIYVVFEEIYAFRFLYRNLTDIVERDNDIGRKFARLLDLKKKTVESICKRLIEAEIMQASDDDIDRLADGIVMTITYWLPFVDLKKGTSDAATIIHQGVFQVMSSIAPYLGESQRQFHDECRNLIEGAS